VKQLKAIFAFDQSGVNIPRGLGVICILVIPLVVLSLIKKQAYWLSASLGALFVGLSDTGATIASGYERWHGSRWPEPS